MYREDGPKTRALDEYPERVVSFLNTAGKFMLAGGVVCEGSSFGYYLGSAGIVLLLSSYVAEGACCFEENKNYLKELGQREIRVSRFSGIEIISNPKG